jgi:LuxR family maltose regulon positive regulatory protein
VSPDVDEPAAGADVPLLLVTKLHPPVVPRQTVARERLFRRLSDVSGSRLTLVACPAGFGKSTLLAAWRDAESLHRPVGWVTLDEGDDDPVVLWLHVVEALARACPGLDGPALSGSISGAPLVEVGLPRLVNALADQPELALVLDDLHRVSSPASLQSVAWFLDRMPPTVQLVISSRSDPALPLGTLRARGQLLELRAPELRFTGEEATEFLNDRLGLDLAAADIDLLLARTEGWPAGLYLAALSLNGTTDKTSVVRSFDGTSPYVVDFLAGEVLAGFEPALQAFMLRTSVLERLSAPLCDALLESRASKQSLEALARSNLFLIPLDDHREWFRFHHLFAQILRLELGRREPGLVSELHRRAAAWHAEFGTTGEAIHHAVEGGDFAAASTLIRTSWAQHANTGRTSSVLEWIGRFPPSVLDADRELLLVKAWASALAGREGDQASAVEQVLAFGDLDHGPLLDGFSTVDASVSLLRATFAWGDVSALLTHGARSAELEEPGSPFRPVTTWALGWGHYLSGDLDEAERWLTETASIAPGQDQWIVGLAAMGDLSLIAGLRGDRDAQLQLATDTLRLTGERGMLEAVEIGEVFAAMGTALAAHGRHAEALPHLEQGVFTRRIWAQPLDLIDGLLALAPTVAALGDALRAEAVLEEAGALIAGCADPGILGERLERARHLAQLAPHVAHAVDTEPAISPGPEDLSERELTVVRLLGSGLTEREIGRELFISFNTVHSHVKSAYRKLGVSSRSAALARAGELRLL